MMTYHYVVNSEAIMYANANSVAKHINLTDGSFVWLGANSKLTLNPKFAEKGRDVELKGEAYFNVKTNQDIPFTVKTSSINVRVLGTAFNVNASDNSTTEVVLERGVVRLLTLDGVSLVRLQPDQRAVYNIADGDIEVNNILAELFVTKRYDLIYMKEDRKSVV